MPVHQVCVESNMYTLNDIGFSWITGMMFGIEFLFPNESTGMDSPNSKFLFGVAIDFGIFRILYQKYRITE